jgi:dipeptidyl aminopeptidase/acylaminoacyl peptidase
MKNILILLCISVFFAINLTHADSPITCLSETDLLSIRTCEDAAISPDGKWIAYTISVPRAATEKAGSAWRELYVFSLKSVRSKPFITGRVNIYEPRWKPDGSMLAFRAKRGEDKFTQVWGIAIDGGEAVQLTNSVNNVESFRWHPDGNRIAYIAETPLSAKEKELREKGYGFVFYQENLKNKNLYIEDLAIKEPEPLTSGKTIWDFEFSSDGNWIAASVSPHNLIDERYMERKIYTLNLKTKEMKQVSENKGKLGNYKFNRSGDKLVYAAALEQKDHQISQVYVTNLTDGKTINLTPEKFRGHVTLVDWYDDKTVLYRAGEGVWSTYSTISSSGGKRKIILDSKETGVIYDQMTRSVDGKAAAMLGSTPSVPREVYYRDGVSVPQRLTDVNPWLAERNLGLQKLVTYKARDGQDVEGLLIYPVDAKQGVRYPLVVYVHGGPEHHHYFDWCSYYSEPGQVLAGKGYYVFYPNYRSSTGYGLEFALAGYGDPAGVEFDDIADGIDYLISENMVDKNRVGIAGGSYGGYAAAWFASYYTEKVKAASMFVGISDLISKRGTTDIPNEELYVHSGTKLEEMWDISLKRSPIYYAHKSKTALLILGGTDDTRVYPAQSMEMYWRLKMNGHQAVRLVQYPGERHGNSKQTSRIDLLYRQIAWFEWYLGDQKPVNGPMPPLDISDQYGLNLD